MGQDSMVYFFEELMLFKYLESNFKFFYDYKYRCIMEENVNVL